MNRRRWLVLVAVSAAAMLMAGRALSQLYVDYAWYAAMGASDVWRARVTAMLVLRGGSGIAAMLFVFANLYAVRRSVVSLVLPRRMANLEIGEEVPASYLMLAVLGVSVVLGSLLSLPQGSWSELVLARSGRAFGETDPYFGVDLGFFVYWLPLERMVFTWTFISVLIVAALVLFLYALTPSLRWERGSLYVSAYVRRHLTVLAGVLLLVLAWSYRLEMYGRLSSGSGPEGAFTYLDHRVGIPGDLVLAIVTFGAALIVGWSGWTGQLRLASSAIFGVVALSVIVRQVTPFVVGRVTADSDTSSRAIPYDGMRAGYTRRAFAVDRIAPVDSTVPFTNLSDAARGIPNWDPQAIVAALRRIPGTDWAPGHLGWRAFVSAATPTMTGPVGVGIIPSAEGATAPAPFGVEVEAPEHPVGGDSAAVPWVLTRILASAVDEHGGIVRVPAGGLASPRGESQLAQPVMVFDSARGDLIVGDSLNRITGVSLENTVSRVAHAWGFQRPLFLFGDLPRPRPTVVMHRDVRGRIGALVPFFVQGSTVVPSTRGDSLFWIVDLYSASSFYPLSRRVLVDGDIRSYFQHAATAIVEANTGEMYIVPDSTLDPVASTWTHRFPEIFSSWSALPAGFADAVPPATDGVRAQAIAFGRFGNSPTNEPPRQIPVVDGADSALVGADPMFVALHRAKGGTPTALSIPLLDQSERVRGLMVGVGGRIRRTFWCPLASPGERWPTIIDRLRGLDSATIREPGLQRGAVHAYPLAGGDAVYVQSAYTWRSDAPPILAKVSVLVQDTLRNGGTLSQIAGTDTAAGDLRVPPRSTSVIRSFQSRVDSLYVTMREALRRGDMTAFGTAFDQLGRVVGRLPARREAPH